MYDRKRVRPGSECQACRGTGYVAGSQPIKTGPYIIDPPPCGVCGGSGRAPQPKD
jgi:DnaJ-class molecular chaperone